MRIRFLPPAAGQRSRLLAVLLLVAAPAQDARGQVGNVAALAGDWTRLNSSYEPNDQMRIRVAGTAAIVTFRHASVIDAFQNGTTLWQGIQGNGRAQVLGSDGQYYPASMRLDEAGRLHVQVEHGGKGSEQVWGRAGPSVDGEWVRITPGDPLDGTRIRVDGRHASVRFLPSAAPRNLRIGSRVWQNIRDSSKVDLLDDGGQYRTGTMRLEGEDRLWITSSGGKELWVRQEHAEQARATFADAAGAAGAGSPAAP